MTFLVIGLGNPGDEYENTRHNIGRMAVESFAEHIDADDWSTDSKAQSHISTGLSGSQKAVCVLPDTFMNKSGIAVAYLAKIKKTKPENIIVVYDDVDLPAGSIKLSFGRGSGGHRGLESVIKHLKTRDFARVRIGVSPTTPSGKLKKPSGDDKIRAFLLSPMRTADKTRFEKVFRQTDEAIEAIIKEGREKAMNRFN